ncbi:MAG: hypothetical protein B0D92_01305 [Spirochaeta sp. LUC14_002_19_P3]|nr:MAG: hypothetical protein B0D92_01305 [Spirochaeta sp. LUC14_002_19_P3]
MIEKTLEVGNEEGLHTRPANKFVKIVKEGQSEVSLSKNGVEAPGKSLLKIMKLGIVQGDKITVRCDGPDENEVMASITALVQ